MGTVLNKCNGKESTQRRVGEKDLHNDEDEHMTQEYQYRRSFVHNPNHNENLEDLIQDVATHSRWEFFEVRYLLAYFRTLYDKTGPLQLTMEQLITMLPRVMDRLFINFNEFAKSKSYSKWTKRIYDIFISGAPNDKAVSFPLFARILEIACRGSEKEKARLLFNLFDLDGDGTWNMEELQLFLDNVVAHQENAIQINTINEGVEKAPLSQEPSVDLDAIVVKSESFVGSSQVREIVNRDKFVEYVQLLLQPEEQHTEKGTSKSNISTTNINTTATSNNTNAKAVDNGEVALLNNHVHMNQDKDHSDILQKLTPEYVNKLSEFELWKAINNLFNERLMKKNKLGMEEFIVFASMCINLNNLFESFNVIPSQQDEKKKIKELITGNSRQLGQSWYVLSQKWWEMWCTYVQWDVVESTCSKHGESENTSSTSKDLHHHLRPLKIDNADLLDASAHIPILRNDMQEGTHYQLVNIDVWTQLREWYGGGPEIEREVVSVDQSVRLQLARIYCKKLLIEYQLKERDYQEEKTNQDAKNKGKNQNSPSRPTKDNNKVYDKAEIDKQLKELEQERSLLLQELNVTINPDTLRIDMYPVYLCCCTLNNKGMVDTTQLQDYIRVSRYATLPEMYLIISACLGMSVENVNGLMEQYEKYVEMQIQKKKEKANANKDSKSEQATTINLPPRLWLLDDRSHRTTKLVYPFLRKKFLQKYEQKEEKDNKNDKPTTNDTKTDSTTTPVQNGATSTDPSNITSTITTNSTTNNDTTTINTTTSTPNTTLPSATTPGNSDPETTEPESDELDDTIYQFGIVSGIKLGMELADKEKGKYLLQSMQESTLLAEEIDEVWTNFELKMELDAKDRCGQWYEAHVVAIKPAGEPVTKDPRADPAKQDMEKLKQVVGLFVKYKDWAEKWNDWIYVQNEALCRCKKQCSISEHRLALVRTQSQWKQNNKPQGSYNSTSYTPDLERRATVAGAPTTEGVVGLSNLGNTCFMNSIIQCVSNTSPLRNFFISGQYKVEINKNNPLGQQGRLANEFARLLTDIWSGKYCVVAPRSFKKAIENFAPMFSGWQQHDSQEFLGYVLDGLHEDLNLIQKKPFTEKIESDGRPDAEVAKLSWKLHLLRNQSKIVDLFQAQYKSRVVCPECNRISITFDTYMYLSVPIAGSYAKSLVVDVFHLGQGKNIKPYRHTFNMKKVDKLGDLAQIIAKEYKCKPELVLFYSAYGSQLEHDLDHSTNLGLLHEPVDEYKAYILRDWNREVTKEDIEKKKLKLQVAKVSFCSPIATFLKNIEEGTTNSTRKINQKIGMSTASRANETPLFGLPFAFTFLNIHTCRELHKILYQRLYQWAPELLSKAWKNANLDIKPNLQRPPAATIVTESKEENDSKGSPTPDLEMPILHLTEEEWTKVFEHLPYRLLLLPSAKYIFSPQRTLPDLIEPSDKIFVQSVDNKYRREGFDFVVEWKQEYYEGDDLAKATFSTAISHESYVEWQQQNSQRKNKSGALTLYDCIDAWCAEEKLTQNDTWYCNKCNKHMEALKKLDIWSFPEILIVHLKRFQVLNRSGRGEKINTLIDFPIRGLDLSKYVINSELQSKPIYDLYAVSCHSGGLGGGHYTAYALNSKTDRWYNFNDSMARPARTSEIVDPSAYVLFYRKCH